MAADVDQLNAVIAQADRHQALLASALLKLESRIADIMATAPLRDGDLFDLEWAVQARVQLREAIEQEYLSVVDGIVRDYSV
jgi:predicted component of type VI protein secretion system